MKKNNSILTSLLFSILLLFSNVGFAANENIDKEVVDQQINSIFEREIDFENDYAHRWMKAMFGEFVFDIFSDTPSEAADATILTKVLSFTNILALILGVIIVGYTFVGGSLSSAAEGEILGKSWSTMWVPVRTVIGLGMIMPIKIGGTAILSAAQVFVLWLIILGSNAASFLWDNTVDMLFGNVTITNPKGEISKFVDSGQVFFGPEKVMQVYNQLLCTEGMIRYNTYGLDDSGDKSVKAANYRTGNISRNEKLNIDARTIAASYDRDFKEITRIIADQKYPGNTDQYSMGKIDFTSLFNNPDAFLIRFANGKCGVVQKSGLGDSYEETKMDVKKGQWLELADTYIESKTSHNSYKGLLETQINLNAFKEAGTIYNEMMPFVLAMSYHHSIDEKHFPYADKGYLPLGVGLTKMLQDPDDNEVHVSIYNLMTDELAELIEIIDKNYVKAVTSTISEATQSQTMSDKFKKGGWVMAGTWFHELSSNQDISSRAIKDVTDNLIKVRSAKFDDRQCTPNDKWYSSDDTCEETKEMHKEVERMSLHLFESAGAVPKSIASNAFYEIEKCKTNIMSCSLPEDIAKSYSVASAKWLLDGIMEGHASDEPLSDEFSGMENPFKVIASIGHRANSIAGTAFTLSGVFYAIEKAGGSIRFPMDADGGLTNATARFFVSFIFFIAMQLFSIAVMFLSTGFMLAYVIPFLPLLTWILMIIGYFLTTIEALIASSLAVIMMITPEGQGIVGSRLERAIMLLVSLIMKPPLMVIGIIASITMSYVGFEILNVMFWKSAPYIMDINDIQAASFWSTTSNPVTGIFGFFAVFSIYVMMLYNVTKYTVSIMHRLPEQILEWFGGGIARPFGENEIGSTTQAATSEIKGGFQQMGGGAGKLIKEARHERKERSDRLKEKTEDANDGKA